MKVVSTQLLTACVGVSLIIAAQAAPFETVAIDLPEFRKEALLNGFEILFVPGTDQESQFLLMLRNGAAFDPVDKWGATLVMARMMLDSTEKAEADQLRFALQSIDARIEAHVDYDAIFFVGSAPNARLPDALKILADIVTAPRFDEQRFQQMRQALLEEKLAEGERPSVVTEERLAAAVFGPNPYGHPIKGVPETLRNLTLADIKIQYRRLCVPNQAQLAIHTTLNSEELLRTLGRNWGRWVRDEALPFTFRRAPETEGAHIVLIDSDGPSLFRWGRLGVARADSDYHALKIFEQYLLLSLPEWAQTIDDRDHIQAVPQIDARRMQGLVQLSLQADPDRLVKYYRRFQKFLADIQAGKLDADRFEEARRLALLDFKTNLANPLTRMRILVEMSLFEIGAGYITTYELRLDRVTPERFTETIRRLIPLDSFVLVVSGPKDRLAPQFRDLGRVESAAP